MSPLKFLALFTVMIALALPSAASEPVKEAGEGAALEAALQKALTNPNLRTEIRIEASGRLAQDLHFLSLYGRGVGFWNRERQFELTSSQVGQVLDIILKHHLCRLPGDIGGEQEEEPETLREKPGPPHRRDAENPRFLLRTLTITAGGLSRTITQEATVPEAAPLEKGLAELASLCRKPAAKGITAHSLEEGLALVAKGKLAPEALTLSVNAPQLRSLQDTNGQGWILRIEHGRVIVLSHSLKRGYVTVANHPMEAREARKLAKELLDAGITTLPNQVNTPGYLQLRLRVLSDTTQVMARTFAGKPSPEAAKAVHTFATIRNLLRSAWERNAEAQKPPES